MQDLCDVFNRKEFQPLLEADVAAYLYHRLLENGCPLSSLYSETRVCGIGGEKRKFDIVIGAVNTSLACIQPVLVAQIKCFQRWGFTHQQLKRRFEDIITEDIESLKQLAHVLQSGRIEIVADFRFTRQGTGYLSGIWNQQRRRDVLADLCKASGITLFWVRPNRRDELEVEQIV